LKEKDFVSEGNRVIIRNKILKSKEERLKKHNKIAMLKEKCKRLLHP